MGLCILRIYPEFLIYTVKFFIDVRQKSVGVANAFVILILNYLRINKRSETLFDIKVFLYLFSINNAILSQSYNCVIGFDKWECTEM